MLEWPNGVNKMHYLRLVPSVSNMVVVKFSKTILICIRERESQQHCQKELKAQKKKKNLKPYGEVLTEAEVCCSDKYPAADAKCSNAMEQKQRA